MPKNSMKKLRSGHKKNPRPVHRELSEEREGAILIKLVT
jgi:hypothetical protein